MKAVHKFAAGIFVLALLGVVASQVTPTSAFTTSTTVSAICSLSPTPA